MTDTKSVPDARTIAARSKYDAFKRAYEDTPSQDNEGYIPNRGGFKAGFYAAWNIKDSEILELKNQVEQLRLMCESYSRQLKLVTTTQKLGFKER